MGIYVFRSKHDPRWIKVGHHRITQKRPSVYCRVARRGFHSCIHPTELRGHLNADDFELVSWFPTLTSRQEGSLHKAFRAKSHGEFHSADDLPFILKLCREWGEEVAVPDRDIASGGGGGKTQSSRAQRRAAPGVAERSGCGDSSAA